MSSLILSPGPDDTVNEEEAMRKRDEDQIQEECVFWRLWSPFPCCFLCHDVCPKLFSSAPLQELSADLTVFHILTNFHYFIYKDPTA